MIWTETKFRLVLFGAILAILIPIGIVEFRKAFFLPPEFVPIRRDLQYKGTIVDINYVRSFANIKLSSGANVYSPHASNTAYESPELVNNLRVGDTFRKKAGSDTIVLERSGKTLVFVIDKRINCCN